MLNKTVTTTLILLLTLSILNVINFTAIPRAAASPGVDITQPTSGIAVNTTGFWRAGESIGFNATEFPLLQAVLNATTSPVALNVTVMEAGVYNQTTLTLNAEGVYLKSSVGTGAIINGTGAATMAVDITENHTIVEGFTILKKATTTGPVVRLVTPKHNVTIRNNIINSTGAASWGMNMTGNYTDLVIQNNTFYLDSSDVGIDFNPTLTDNRSTSVTITQNTFVGSTGTAMKFAALNDSTITSNTINGTNVLLGLGDTQNTENVTFANNTWNGISNDGLLIEELGITSSNTTDRQLKNLNITGNTFRNLNSYGICFSNSLEGIDLNNSTIYIYYNNFANVSTTAKGGIYNYVTTPVDINGTYNWWNHAQGPGPVGYGTGENVSTKVTYDPWLSAAYPTVTAYSGLVLNYTQAPPTTFVHVTCANRTFTGSEDVKLYFPSTPSIYLKTVTAEANGTIWSNFTVPELTHGTYTLTAVGQLSSITKTASFIIPQPTIALSPIHGSVGTNVTITGQNFNISDSKVEVFFDSLSVLNVTTNATGGFTSTNTFLVPSKPSGVTYTVNASDGINSGTASFVIPAFDIALNVTSGPPHTPLLVNGTGFTVNGLVPIFFGTNETAHVTISANATGDFSASLEVPEKTAAAYTVKAWDTGTGSNTTETFTILAPSIYLNTTSGPPGKTIEAWGSSWNCSGYVAISFGSTAVLSPATNNTNSTGYLGYATNMTFVVPNLTNGTYTVNATDGINSNTSLTFTISAPTLWLNTTGGPVGSTIMINGTNWKLGTLVDIDIYNSTYSRSLFVTNPTAHATYGNFSDTFTIPTLVIGTYTINATDGITNHNATLSFNVGCAISIDPSSGAANSSITVTGSGFTANANHTIWWDNTLKVTVNATGAGGSFTTNFTIPNVTAGTHNVWGQDSVTLFKTANVTFTVGTPSIYSLSPSDGPAGTLVNVTGLNFQINSTVTVKFVSMTANNTVTTNSTGGFIATFNVPGNYTSGPYTVNATASNYINSATATFTVTYGTGIDAVLDMLEDIEAKLDQYGSFWNFTNTWFTTISNKLGLFTGNDTVASLLYDIKTSVIAINFTSIDNKLGTFSGSDTVASLLSDIKTSVSTINWTDITAIKAQTDTINWADITTIKSTTALSIDYLWGLQDHPLWGLRTKIVPMLESIENATQFTAGTYSTIIPNSTAPVDLGKSSKVTLTVRATDDTTAGFVIKVYIYDGTAWQPLSFSVQGIASADCAATVELTTGADGRLYFETTGATFTAFTYSAEFAP
jgi:hypothetical protein